MARRGYSLLFATGLFFSDIAGIVAGFFSAFYLRFHLYRFLKFIPEPTVIPSVLQYSKAMPMACLVLVLCLWAGGLYRESLSFKKIIRTGSVIRQIFYGLLILSALSGFYRDISFSRLFIFFLFPCFSFYILLGRWLLIRAENNIRRLQGKIRHLIIVGEGEVVEELCKGFSSDNFPGYRLKGYVSIEENISPGVPHLGGLKDMEQILDREDPDEIIISTMNIDHSSLTEIITTCDRRMIQFYIVPDILSFLTSKVELTSVGGINLIGLQIFPLDNGLNRLAKRIMDIMGTLSAFIFFWWLFLVLAIIIKLTSKGPVLFTQVRCHEDGREFIMYKFRTMFEDAEKGIGPVWASEKDSRCTRIGSIMRSLNLDELPQLINVLKGDMSLVGPRPERPHFIRKFKFDIPRYMARHSIRPGMTGWAQVNGLRGNSSLEERVKYDIYYIENWSIWLDFKILFLTFFSYKNAY